MMRKSLCDRFGKYYFYRILLQNDVNFISKIGYTVAHNASMRLRVGIVIG